MTYHMTTTDYRAAFRSRVNLAAAHIARGTPSTRSFDNCFEMNDGDYVVTALARRAAADPAGSLARNISNYLVSVQDTADELKHIPTRELPKHAEACIIKANRNFDKWMAEHQA